MKIESSYDDLLESRGSQNPRLNDLVQTSSDGAQHIAEAAKELSRTIQQIASVTQQSSVGVQQSAQGARQLSELSNNWWGNLNWMGLDTPASP